MSNTLSMVGDSLFPGIGTAGTSAARSLLPSMPEVPEPVSVGPRNPEIERRATQDFKTREDAIQRAAIAAGATRSENDADLLGYTPVKRRSASRSLLGGR